MNAISTASNKGHTASASGPLRRPTVMVFDVNETLSDMSPLSQRFVDVGAPAHLARAWFAGLLRDGFALTAAGATRPFADLGSGLLRVLLPDVSLNRDIGSAVDHIMGGIADLGVHQDVAEGITALAALGIRLVTLSNGSVSVAEDLLGGAGIRSNFDMLLSVDEAGLWKPSARAYAYALGQCSVDSMDAMLVAVHPWDIDGASRAGLATAWLNRDGGAYPDYFIPADVEATSLEHLARQLG